MALSLTPSATLSMARAASLSAQSSAPEVHWCVLQPAAQDGHAYASHAPYSSCTLF